MLIYLMRHAEAVSASNWIGSDHDRPLSPAGIAKFDDALKEMLRLKWPPMPVLSSPYVRAATTANLLTSVLGWKKPIIDDRLASGAYAEAIRKTLLERQSEPSLLLVGHMPELAVFASRVTHEAKLLDTGLLPADIVAIEAPDLTSAWGNGKLLWWRKLVDWKQVKS